MAVIAAQEVEILFTTPPVLSALADVLTAAQRERIRAVHYGGMVVTPQQMLRFQSELFPNALHLSGYGNTLFGCCMELHATPGRDIDYFPFGHRLLFEVDANQEGQGTVRFTRLDESFLIVHMRERDVARLVAPPEQRPGEFELPGLRNPHPPASLNERIAVGIY